MTPTVFTVQSKGVARPVGLPVASTHFLESRRAQVRQATGVSHAAKRRVHSTGERGARRRGSKRKENLRTDEKLNQLLHRRTVKVLPR